MAVFLIILTVSIKCVLNFQINQVESNDSLILKSEWFEFNPEDRILFATSSVKFEDYNGIVQNEQLRTFYNFNGSELRSYKWDWIDYEYYILIDKDFYSHANTTRRLWAVNKFYAHGNFLLIFEKLLHLHDIEVVFQYYFKRHQVYNVIIMNNNKLFTWYPYNTNCNRSVHEINPKDLAKNFKNKLPKKLNNCPLRVAWWPDAFIAINPDDPVEPGTIIVIMNLIAKSMNLSINYVYDESLDPVQLYAQYGHELKLAPNLHKTNVSMVLGCVQDAIYSYYSNYITYGTIQGIVIPPRRRIPKWREFKVFSNELILATIISILVSGYVYARLTKQPLIEAAFRIYRLCFQLSLDTLPQKWRLRIYFIFLMLFVMEISAAYLSCMSGVFTRPSLEPQITTLEEFMESDIPFLGIIQDINYMKSLVTENKRRPWAKDKFISIPFDETLHYRNMLYKYVIDRGYAIWGAFTPEDLKRYRHIGLIPMGPPRSTHFLYRYNFHLGELIDGHIRQLHESGLMQILWNPARWIIYDEHESIRVLNVDDLYGVFVIWLCGLAISSIVFTFEIIHYKREQRLLRIRRRLAFV